VTAAHGTPAAAKVDTLAGLAADMETARPLESVVELVIGQIAEVIAHDAAGVWLHEDDDDLWYMAGSRGMSWRASRVRFRGSQALHSRIAPEGEILDDLDAVGFSRLYPEHDTIRSVLYAPISISGRRVGLIGLYRKTDERFTAEELSFVRTVGAQVGMAASFAALEARSERLAVMEERARLGADLHDGVLQILSSVRLYARELRRELERRASGRAAPVAPGAEELLAELERCLEEGSEEITAAIERLRRPELKLDIARSLELTRERLQNAGIATELVYELGDVAPDISDALAWISREAASNILRHSRAGNVVLEVRASGPVAELLISDDGVGVNAGNRADGEDHLGRHIMRERAEQLGGTCSVHSDSGGTRVHARIPVEHAGAWP
jgi:nitrate/nitrite-specific signal transduction histidine kinase